MTEEDFTRAHYGDAPPEYPPPCWLWNAATGALEFGLCWSLEILFLAVMVAVLFAVLWPSS